MKRASTRLQRGSDLEPREKSIAAGQAGDREQRPKVTTVGENEGGEAGQQQEEETGSEERLSSLVFWFLAIFFLNGRVG